jgi:hypothetical protein
MIDHKRTDRISARYFSSSRDEIHENDGVYVYRFHQDVHTKILPYQRDKFQFTFSTTDEDLQQAVTNIFSPGSTNSFRRDHDLDEFVRDIAMYLAYHGVTYREIVREQNPNDNIAVITLQYIPGKVELVRRRGYRQLIPAGDQEQYGGEYITIPVDKIWTFTLPEVLGNVAKQKNLIRQLRILSKTPQFVSDDLQRMAMDRSFDQKQLSLRQSIEAACITQKWGWAANIMWDKYMTEYFEIYRRLRFLAALSVLRGHIIHSMNTLLNRLDIDCSISIEGLPTETEINEQIEKLNSGEIGFSEVSDFLGY